MQVYLHAGALAAFAALVAGASVALALLAWRRARPAVVRALGGTATVVQFGWLVVAVQGDPVRLARFALLDVPVPPWFHLAQGVLVLTVLLAAVGALVTLVLAGGDR